MQISIITAGWRKDGVENVFKSLAAQTYQEWEHIIVNDCSPQITHQNLLDWCKNDHRRHFIDLGVHTGYYGAFARNIGVMAAFTYFSERSRKNDRDFWIVFHDDDNYWYPDLLESMVKAHQQNPKALMIGVNIEIRGKKNLEFKMIRENQLLSQRTDLGAWMYKKEVFDKYGYFQADLEHKISYDWDFLKRLKNQIGEDKFFIIDGQLKLIFNHKRY